MNEETKKSPCDIPGACAKMNRKCDVCATAAPVAPAGWSFEVRQDSGGEFVSIYGPPPPLTSDRNQRTSDAVYKSGNRDLFDLLARLADHQAAPAAPVACQYSLIGELVEALKRAEEEIQTIRPAGEPISDYGLSTMRVIRDVIARTVLALHPASDPSKAMQPLTDEQIDRISRQHHGGADPQEWARNFASASIAEFCKVNGIGQGGSA